jgi:ubiquitin-conjugating enzyme E2 Z
LLQFILFSAHGIWSALISIQSLLGETPFKNEPGFERSGNGHDYSSLIKDYNHKIMHETIRISVCDRLEGYLGKNKHIDRSFEDECKSLFLAYYYRYLVRLLLKIFGAQMLLLNFKL